jgi:hypothetical protein
MQLWFLLELLFQLLRALALGISLMDIFGWSTETTRAFIILLRRNGFN